MTLQAARDDPTGFVDYDAPMVIDEIQLVPDLLRPIKVKVDLDSTPGRFLLTGSSRVGLLAGRTGGLLVPAALANLSGIPRTTLVRYLELLSSVFLIKSIPAWSSGQTHRAVGTPKLAFVDTGIAAHLIGQDASRLGEPGGAAGSMMENFVVMELARQLTWSAERARLFHYRTKDQVEVDAVLETADGRVVGVEVKAGSTVRTEDLRGLRHLANTLGDRFVAGFVLYTGQQTLPFGKNIRALPLDALWRLSS